MSEELTVMRELLLIAQRLDALAGSAIWRNVTEDLSPRQRARVFTRLREIEATARAMAEPLDPGGGQNYGVQR